MRYIILFLFPIFLYSTTISSKLSYYEDTASLDFQQIKKQKYIPMDNNYLKKGFNNNNIWIKIKIQNHSNQDIRQVLHLNNPTINYLDFYSSEKLLVSTGNHKLATTKDIDDLYFAFNLSLPKQSTSIYYLKIQTVNTLSIKFTIDDLKIYQHTVETKKIFLIFFFGFVSSIVIYNLFLFLILKERIYLYYVIFQSLTLVLFIAFSGLGSYILWQDNFHINSFILKNIDDFAIIFALFFVQKFLHIKQYSKILNILINIVIFLLSIVMITPFTHKFSTLMMPIMLMGLFLILFISIYGVYKKIPTAKLFLFGWLILVTGSIITLLQNFGYLEVSFLSAWGMYLGSMVEAVIFSIALAAKIELLKQEKEKLLQNLSSQLNTEVTKKTKELNETLEQKKLLLKEVNHRTKNSLQIISSFVNMLSINEKDTRVQSDYKSLNSKIQALSSLHQFYNNAKLTNIDTQKYILDIIKNLTYLTPKDKTIDYNLDICKEYINIEQLTILGLIINELITNSLKYAFKDKCVGTITIKLIKKDNFILNIQDNGIGFEFDNYKHNSIGLKLVYRLATKQLNSDMDFINYKGSCYKFEFKGDLNV